MTNEEKLDKYDWTFYITKELFMCELEELKSNWKESAIDTYNRGIATTYRDTLYHLTDDPLWQKSLEELKEILK